MASFFSEQNRSAMGNLARPRLRQSLMVSIAAMADSELGARSDIEDLVEKDREIRVEKNWGC
uniref:Uncharacterized protein K0116D04.10 n=1 Tax=Oryza sativa subsp. indica TaxID=39946 RepID=C8TFB4_ORYSI|nr:hypothetical protein [Oryza sativa Indica Group]BAI39967.1 hypothetical protein [Oryza sativa Indica Group]